MPGRRTGYQPGLSWSSIPAGIERTFSLADLAYGPAPAPAYRRARESRGALAVRLAGPTTLEVKEHDGVVAKLAMRDGGGRINSFSLVAGDRVAIGDKWGLCLFDARTGAAIREFVGHTSEVWAVAPSPDGRFLLSASDDQTLRIWNPDRAEPLVSLFFAGDDWIAWTPEGYYAASRGGENLMGWQISNGLEQLGTFVPASQFHKSLYRPDVIKLLLSSQTTQLRSNPSPIAAIRRMPRLDLFFGGYPTVRLKPDLR
jgi:WD40 repeat protein